MSPTLGLNLNKRRIDAGKGIDCYNQRQKGNLRGTACTCEHNYSVNWKIPINNELLNDVIRKSNLIYNSIVSLLKQCHKH